MKKILKKDILNLCSINLELRNKEINKIKENGGNFYDPKNLNKIRYHYGVSFGGTKKEGKLYHAYCCFQSVIKHEYKSGFFEDCASTKQENIKEAIKKGWSIGRINYPEYDNMNDVAVCPECIKKIKNDYDGFKNLIENWKPDIE